MTAILNKDLTTTEVDGTGLFDELMTAAEKRLKVEHKDGRITGTEYGKVYLGSMSTSMSQAISFLLGRQAADKQADLLGQQATNELLKNALIQCEIDKCTAQIANITQDTANKLTENQNLINTGLGILQQTAKVNADTALSVATELRVDQETLVTAQDVLKRTQEVLLTTAQIGKVNQDTATGVQQQANVTQDTLVKVAQVSSINQDISESQQKVLNLIQQALETVAKTGNVGQDTTNKVSTNTVITNTGLKVAQETALLTQKVLTEEAQIVNRVSGAALDVAGVVGQQVLLYGRQADGFLRDAEQKAAKLQLDALNVRVSADPNAGTTPTSLANTEINAIMAVLKAGAGA